MLKRRTGAKGILLSCVMILVLLSGCDRHLTEQKQAAAANWDTERLETAEPLESDNGETAAPTESESQIQVRDILELTDNNKAFLAKMCRELNDFNAQTVRDDKFWCDFLFYSYTGALSGQMETVYREDLGVEENVVKVSRQEAEDHARLVFGEELPDIKPAFEDMEEGQTAFYYLDGYYYIGISDFPDYQYTFSETAKEEEAETDTIVTYTIDFEGESNVGTVTFVVSPEKNENGFVIRSKDTRFFN